MDRVPQGPCSPTLASGRASAPPVAPPESSSRRAACRAPGGCRASMIYCRRSGRPRQRRPLRHASCDDRPDGRSNRPPPHPYDCPRLRKRDYGIATGVFSDGDCLQRCSQRAPLASMRGSRRRFQAAFPAATGSPRRHDRGGDVGRHGRLRLALKLLSSIYDVNYRRVLANRRLPPVPAGRQEPIGPCGSESFHAFARYPYGGQQPLPIRFSAARKSAAGILQPAH